ncbi:hypothetical protein [Collimonas antrihumi]|uniref:hypothetical protein n=1 Tax=Collimonas antrihumi TaxID=1940615 RepID=UPI001B8BA3FB|nr:hypothetical protein [Collimonas antrihumi]
MNLDFKEQDHMYSKPLRFTFFRYSNTLVAMRLLALLPLLLLSLQLLLPIGCLASR